MSKVGKKKRVQQNTEEYIQLSNGVLLQAAGITQEKSWVSLLAKGVMVFLLTFGCLGGFLSAFEVEYNEGLFLLILLLSCVYFSMIYYSHFTRDVGYVVFFGVFLTVALKYRMYINSGFYAIINELIQSMVDYYDLPGANEYSEFISDRYVTITAVACFIGIVQALMLNINMLGRMRALGCVVFSAAVYFFPVYLNQEPDMLFVFCTIAGLGCVLLGKVGGHYEATLLEQKKHKKRVKKRQKYISYERSAKISVQTVLLAVITGMFCIWGMGVLIPKADFEQEKPQSEFKNTVDAAVLNVWEYGIDGLFHNQNAAGGMSKGKLGRNTSVQPDYQTDLILTFTPYSTDTIYLKAYTGVVYADSQWENDVSLFQFPKDVRPWEEKFKNDSMHAEAFRLQEQYRQGEEQRAARGIMKVKNVDADADFLYYPYYTMFDDYGNYYGQNDGLAVGEEHTYSYYPGLPATTSLNSSVDEIYLDVPTKNRETVAFFCEQMDLSGSNWDKIGQVIEYFQENIPYTVRPGAVPKDEDTINYFLGKNKKGYCAHFASSAVLIFRYLGIPARYVEGYAVHYNQVLEGEIRSEKYSDYYDGYSELGETAVVEVEVSDASAHAWVEVYDENRGWVCVDVTPSSEDEEIAGGDFWSFLGNLLSGEEETENTQTQGENHGSSLNINFSKFAYLLGGLVCIFFLVSVFHVAKKLGIFHHRQEKERLLAEYHILCEMVRSIREEFNACFSHKEQLQWLVKEFDMEIEDIEQQVKVLEGISYSCGQMEEVVLKEQRAELRALQKQIMHKCSLKEKIKIFWFWIGKAC